MSQIEETVRSLVVGMAQRHGNISGFVPKPSGKFRIEYRRGPDTIGYIEIQGKEYDPELKTVVLNAKGYDNEVNSFDVGGSYSTEMDAFDRQFSLKCPGVFL